MSHFGTCYYYMTQKVKQMGYIIPGKFSTFGEWNEIITIFVLAIKPTKDKPSMGVKGKPRRGPWLFYFMLAKLLARIGKNIMFWRIINSFHIPQIADNNVNKLSIIINIIPLRATWIK